MSQEIKVLVLDDEPVVCERLQDYLEKKGMTVEAYTESQRALDRLNEKAFDVIVTDMKMEGPTGMDVLLAVKRGSYNSEVIIITGYGSSEDLREAEAVGVFEYIGKPFKMSDMYNLVKKAARRAQKRSK
ncbi:MAG: response regulator [Candidatus Latescibacteria bacterium]|nr:response regulator [Candidatus Latescibacterota bacterium]NIO56273.1 response regulator [Candidatus Latescibacterota bacterium]